MSTLYTSKYINHKHVNIDDAFWNPILKLVGEEVLPYQWEVLNDRVPGIEKSHAIQNLRIAAGDATGDFYGFVFQDSDVAKWLEAVGFYLQKHKNEALEKIADEVIELISRAQMPDGYLDTYFQIKEPHKRWTNLYECHELYVAGHLIEAGVAYYEATGKSKILEVCCKMADHLVKMFGEEEGKIKGYPGHQEIELALVKLYNVTQREEYLNLARFFITERGKEPNYFVIEWETTRNKMTHWGNHPCGKPDLKYNQAHQPIYDQQVAVGHAVRAMYMYTGMADVAALTNDDKLLQTCQTLWDNVTKKQMYITGGVGSNVHGESFSFDYDLPNDTMYCETCASIGLIFFAQRLQQIIPNSEYADIIEKCLYNIVLGSISADGKRYFYVNPLEVDPISSKLDSRKHHVKPERQPWFSCACCPPNVVRLLTSLGNYIYTSNDKEIYLHQYISSDLIYKIKDTDVKITQQGSYLEDGKMHITLSLPTPAEFTLALRIPKWAKQAIIKINGEEITYSNYLVDGYVKLTRVWNDQDTISIKFALGIIIMESHPFVKYNTGKVCVMRGPLVYCLEEVDNGKNLAGLSLDITKPLHYHQDGRIGYIIGNGYRLTLTGWDGMLYRPLMQTEESCELRFVPYHTWGNRGVGEMMVWIRKH